MITNKNSSVDWFIEQLEEKGNAGANTSLRTVQISIDISDYVELKRQAKAMHEKQMVDFAYKHTDWGNPIDEIIKDYNETFNNDGNSNN